MRRRSGKRKLRGPWKNIHSAIWLIGLAILALNNWWWPGILFLVAASTIAEAVIVKTVPDASIEEEIEDDDYARGRAAVDSDPASPPPPAPPEPAVPDPSVAAANELVRRMDLLPSTCPRCGAPVRAHEVKWASPERADCSFCGSPLPMSRPKG